MDDSCEPGGKLCRGGSDSTLYCSLIDGGRNKSGSKQFARVRHSTVDASGCGTHCTTTNIARPEEGLVACYILFSSLSLIIYDRHVRRTRTCAHMHTFVHVHNNDERLRFIPRPREHAAAHRRSTRTRSCSAAAGCPAAAANGRTPTGTVERPLRGLCRRAVII